MFQRQWRFLWGHTARHVGILVPGPGIKLVPPAVEAQSLNRWTSREVPKVVKMLFCFPRITYRRLSPTTRKVFSRLLLILEKEMAPHSSTLTWKIPWSDEPGRLQSMGSLRLGHDWETSLSLFTFMHWRRKWQPTPVFLTGKSQGWRSLVGCHLWGHTESVTTEAS